ncbi:MAG: SPFH domain-containing protein [Lachnospiraceae bacterium]|jgi:membrane protease subunit (stomatin/prohibitin family)|nr:SPFH domain-containing protein [Lachnospiraceae bacterium]
MAVVEVIKYDSVPDVFAWKYPNTELGTWTQLIVNETQEAILFKGGQSLDLFGPGRHTLDTANIPFLNKIVNIPFGGRSPFSAEVWYINKINSLAIKWGTATPIQLQDPKYQVFIPVRAFGQFGIKIADSKKFIQSLVGTLASFTSDDILKYFRGLYLTKVKDDIASYLINKKISVLEINAYINEISESLKETIKPTFAEFGIELVNFFVNDISVPEEDSAVQKLKDALAKKAEMDIVGYNYREERSFNTLEGAAKNEGSAAAPLMGAGIGLGMGLGVGGTFGGAMEGITKNMSTGEQKQCPACHKNVEITAKFCPHCGKDTTQLENDVVCAKCGGHNNVGTKFCGSCGNVLIKVCPKCGEAIKEGLKYCSNCGESLVKKCECGAEINDSLKFCPQCGKKVKEDKNNE